MTCAITEQRAVCPCADEKGPRWHVTKSYNETIQPHRTAVLHTDAAIGAITGELRGAGRTELRLTDAPNIQPG